MRTLMLTILLVLLAGCASDPQIVPLSTKAIPVRDGQPCVADRSNKYRVTGSRIYRAPGSMSPYRCTAYVSFGAKRQFQQIFTQPMLSGAN